MSETLAVILFIAASVVGLILVPFGLPGLWVMVLGVIGYGWLTGFETVGGWTVGVIVVLAFAGEVVESWLGFRFARRYGGGSRAGWGALIGGLIGAVVGVPLPLVGSIVGAFVGAFIGAAVFEYSQSRHTGTAVHAGWGAMLGRAAAAAVKVALGLVIAVVGLFAVLRGTGG